VVTKEEEEYVFADPEGLSCDLGGGSKMHTRITAETLRKEKEQWLYD